MNPVTFDPSKLIDIPFKKMKGGQRIEKDEAYSFWDKEEAKKYKALKGIYIFAIKTTKSILPWYVGKTARTFEVEIFTDDKIEKYNSALAEYDRNFKPCFQFVTPELKKGKPNLRAIDELETTLILWAKERNKKLKNIQNASDTELFLIRDVTTGKVGKPRNEAKHFKEIFGI
jgi:hypothetical protein